MEPISTGPVLEIQGLRFSYKTGKTRRPVLDVPKFTLQPGERRVLFGPSGSGKTTFLNLAALFLTADAGWISVCGTDVTGLTESKRDRFRARHVGYVFQNYNLLQGFTARENVLLAMTFGTGEKNGDRATALLSEVSLSHRTDDLPHTLSFGEQQRVAVARALACNPQLILADEPTASLDPENKAAVLELLHTVSERHGVSLLIVTHDPAVIDSFAGAIPFSGINREPVPSPPAE